LVYQTLAIKLFSKQTRISRLKITLDNHIPDVNTYTSMDNARQEGREKNKSPT